MCAYIKASDLVDEKDNKTSMVYTSSKIIITERWYWWFFSADCQDAVFFISIHFTISSSCWISFPSKCVIKLLFEDIPLKKERTTFSWSKQGTLFECKDKINTLAVLPVNLSSLGMLFIASGRRVYRF